ncbi:MAG: hypothetical protein LBE62_05600 [Azonexus sp.]|jgi:hypothetical protein|nr:hypothetical protein [Azonexus sp.]
MLKSKMEYSILDFSVYDLVLFIEGWDYTTIVPASMEVVAKAAKLRKEKGKNHTSRKASIGDLTASPHRDQASLAVIECTGGVEYD